MSDQLHHTMQRVYEQLGISAQELAQLLGLQIKTIINWHKKGISKLGASKIADAFGISDTWILTGEGERLNTAFAKNQQTPFKNNKQKQSKFSPKEAYLEFLQRDDGVLVLQEMGDSEPWVSICFADKIQEMLGRENIQQIGQHMIQAAIVHFMQKQMNQYHAHVFDEKPKHFS